jgi:DNA-binding response OmpR family regulator
MDGGGAMARRIVVFNHDEHILTLFREVLSKRGFEVLTYLQELISLSEVEKVHPNLIILGYLKGYVENELEMVEQLRAHPTLKELPIIICTTGEIRSQRIGWQEELRYVAIVPKPFNVNDLVEAVDTALKTGNDQIVTQ